MGGVPFWAWTRGFRLGFYRVSEGRSDSEALACLGRSGRRVPQQGKFLLSVTTGCLWQGRPRSKHNVLSDTGNGDAMLQNWLNRFIPAAYVRWVDSARPFLKKK